MKKSVIIIEDNFKDFERIKSVIDSTFECRQKYTDSKDFNPNIPHSFINNLKNSLKVTCSSDEEYAEQLNIIKQLQTELKGYCNEGEDPVFLIDYLLDGGSRENVINGINFKDKFLKEMYPDKIIPVLFITSANHSPKINVEDYVSKVNDKSICDFQTKPNKKDWLIVKDKIISFITNSQSKPRILQKFVQENLSIPKLDKNLKIMQDYEKD
jgi:hypothetical protein